MLTLLLISYFLAFFSVSHLLSLGIHRKEMREITDKMLVMQRRAFLAEKELEHLRFSSPYRSAPLGEYVFTSNKNEDLYL